MFVADEVEGVRAGPKRRPMIVAHVKLEGALALQGTTQMGLEGGMLTV